MSPGQLLCKGKKIKRHSVSENNCCKWKLGAVFGGCSVLRVKFCRALETDFCQYCGCCEVQMFDFMFSPVTQVVSVAISCPSRSSPLTAACGLSSAAAVTGWEKVSLLFMKVSTHFLPCMLNAGSDHTSNNMCRGCSKKKPKKPLFGSPTADVSGILCCINQILARFHIQLYCLQTVQRDDVCVWVWRHSVNPQCINQWISSEHLIFFPKENTDDIAMK